MNGIKIPSDLRRLAARQQPGEAAPEPELCPGCKHGVAVSFRHRSTEWVCGRGVFTLSERRLSGPVTSCGAFEKKAR